jgi:hypothetical protein
MLSDSDFYSIFKILKLLIDFDDFLKVQLFEVYVHSSYEKVNQISLLKFVISKAPQGFQYFRHLPVEIVEACYFSYTLSIFF